MAKLIAYGTTRAEALDKAARAVEGFTITGPKSNLAFHAELLANAEFRSGKYDTGLIGRMRA
jgi:acetyl-CoA carboxylase biotin carboxylase subunit